MGRFSKQVEELEALAKRGLQCAQIGDSFGGLTLGMKDCFQRVAERENVKLIILEDTEHFQKYGKKAWVVRFDGQKEK